MTTAVTRVLIAERPTELRLKATELDYALWERSAVTVFIVEWTSELIRIHEKVTDAAAPFSVRRRTADAFIGSEINRETIGWGEAFVPKFSGANARPPRDVGVTDEEFAKRLKVEVSPLHNQGGCGNDPSHPLRPRRTTCT